MKKLLFLLSALLLLWGCTAEQPPENPYFTELENGNLLSPSGVEYTFLASETDLYYLGELEFAAPVEGEEETSSHMGLTYQTGMFAIENNETLLVRKEPHNEWCSIYRRADLPDFDFSVSNCVRLEYVPGITFPDEDGFHTACGGGMTDPAAIANFVKEVRSQLDLYRAGLYDLCMMPDGVLKNCYICGSIYGFFEEEPNLVIKMEVLSYDDQAYSLWLSNRDYVLPEALLLQLRALQCAS